MNRPDTTPMTAAQRRGLAALDSLMEVLHRAGWRAIVILERDIEPTPLRPELAAFVASSSAVERQVLLGGIDGSRLTDVLRDVIADEESDPVTEEEAS